MRIFDNIILSIAKLRLYHHTRLHTMKTENEEKKKKKKKQSPINRSTYFRDDQLLIYRVNRRFSCEYLRFATAILPIKTSHFTYERTEVTNYRQCECIAF